MLFVRVMRRWNECRLFIFVSVCLDPGLSSCSIKISQLIVSRFSQAEKEYKRVVYIHKAKKQA